MKTKHTPAPWQTDTGGGVQVYAVPSGRTIAIVLSTQVEENHKADSLLIAAAPDMLAELKNIYSELQYDPSNWSLLREQTLATIRKAEGE